MPNSDRLRIDGDGRRQSRRGSTVAGQALSQPAIGCLVELVATPERPSPVMPDIRERSSNLLSPSQRSIMRAAWLKRLR